MIVATKYDSTHGMGGLPILEPNRANFCEKLPSVI